MRYIVILSALFILKFDYIMAFPDPPGSPNVIYAHRIQEKPKIDGKLNEEIWEVNPHFFSGTFIQTEPNNKAKSSQNTEIHIIYNDQAIYIAAKLYDTQPDSILTELGYRDSQGTNTDIFGVSFDTYNNQQNAFQFIVSAAGVQTDIFTTPNGDDSNWNAVWKSNVQITDFGWVVEIEIPYSALRFPKQDKQIWGVNFMRGIRRYREISYWNPVDASINGFVNQFGKLEGLENIKTPVRLSATPYISSYYIQDDVNQVTTQNINGGLDLKYGINESFTLDMALIPDFGQVRSDNVVLNLSPFEVYFNENRPFFTEGTELFNKGGLFYSRRVGKTFGHIDLMNNEEIVERPASAQLLNATKISGRTNKGMGLGFFNAVTKRTTAIIENTETGEQRELEVDPLTNFNVLVFDQNLKNNSNISFINTNVYRAGGGNHANVFGSEFRINDKTNTYRISGFAALSDKINRQIESGEYKHDLGYKYNLSAGKVSGHYQFNLSQNVESDTYNPNDLGFLQSSNKISHNGNVSYQEFQPKGIFNRFSIYTGFWHNMLYKPQTFNNFGLWSEIAGRFKNFMYGGLYTNITPEKSYDYFEPRTEGYYFMRLPSYNFGGWFGTDSRKRFFIEVWGGMWQRPAWSQTDNWFGLVPRFRVSDKFSVSHNAEYIKKRKEPGFVTKTYDDDENLDKIIFGRRDVQTITNTFSAKYSFHARMGIDLRVRHYWSKVEYLNYAQLNTSGEMEGTDYSGLDENGESQHHTNFNAFNVDLVYIWQFAPGSEISIVWKNAINTFHREVNYSFFPNFDRTMNSPQVNNISVKILYFLDYLYLVRNKKEGI